jgi:polysaccharide biosynthesis/export protein PslD
MLACILAPGVALAQSADTTGMDWSRVAEYRIVPGDHLNINFGPSPDQPWRDVLKEVIVRPDGRISVFPVGDVIAAGLTPRELETTLVGLLSADYRSPRLTIEVAKLAGNMVHVLGRVNRPGAYEAGPFMTVSQAIAAAGGFEDDASRNSVLVYHRDGARTVHVARVKFDDAIKQNDFTADLPLSRFDIVYVPRSTVGNVYVFTRQFFGATGSVLSSALTGWELFNLDRVFVAGTVR